jgi:serine/threonine protein kinase
MDLQPGTWVTETVRLESCIATGGMAEVWKGEHVTLGSKVAVKCLLPRIAKRTGAVRRFLREAQISARIDDPHVVRVLDCVVRRGAETAPSAFIVMELLQGEDLGLRLRRLGRLSLDETSAIVDQVACALESAHEIGIVHRDVKPENVFLSARAGRLHVKLLDFGVAKDEASTLVLTGSGLTVGTPLYMSPEQLQGRRDVDARSDVWSLAVVAYGCLAGCDAIGRRSTSLPSRLRADLPPSVDLVFARAFHAQVEARFQRARDFAEALSEARRRPARAVKEPTRIRTPIATARIQVMGEAQRPVPVPAQERSRL